MKSVLFAIVAIFLYALQNVIIQRKLSDVSPIGNMLFFQVPILTLVVTIFLLKNKLGMEIKLPAQDQLAFVFSCSILLFFADFCFFSAYNTGGSLATITTIACLLPVFASFINFVCDGKLPSLTQVLAWIFATISVVLISKS